MDRPNNEPPREMLGRSSVDYVLRTAQQNTLQLSAMADQKASIVLGASFVMATIVFGNGSIDELSLSRMVLAGTALVSGILAALALIPRTNFDEPNKQPNVLFFGAVSRIDEAEYSQRMRSLMATDEAVYEAIIHDLHQASTVLAHRK